MFRVVSLNPRGLAGLLLGLAALTRTLVGFTGTAPFALAKLSARLTATPFTSRASSLKRSGANALLSALSLRQNLDNGGTRS
jgi:hypothetical protein